MKKWKKYGAFIFAVVMCLSLAACGSSDSIAASSEERPDTPLWREIPSSPAPRETE